MNITASLINMYHICRREMWLHAHGIRMEHTSDIVAEGKLIGQDTYPQRAERWTEVEIEGSKIDFFDPKNGIVHEVKKSDAKEWAHVAQVQYYLYILRKNGITANYGIIEYPKLKQTERVELDDEGSRQIELKIADIKGIVDSEQCPPTLNKSKCKSCSYYEFCWTAEEN